MTDRCWMQPLRWSALLAGVCWLAEVDTGRSTEPETSADALQRIEQSIADLGSDRYEVRLQASQQLQQFVGGRWHALLAGRVHQALIAPSDSLEVRVRLEELARNLPAPQVPTEPADRGAIEQAVAELDADSFARRQSAEQRLRWMLNRPESAGPIMTELKRRLAADAVSASTRQRMTQLWHQARSTWLLSDPAIWQLDAVSDEQLDVWIDLIAAHSETAKLRHAVHWAEIDLTDALARDDLRPRVVARLEQQLEQTDLLPAAHARLTRVLEWNHPAMVAEYWQAGRHTLIQHLLIGVPNQPAGAPNASLFDRIDDRTAHCVSGNSLSEGDYPVGVMFPNPQDHRGNFHLVNLDTPRKRLAYEYYVEIDESQRLVDLSRRTMAALIASRRRLSQPEVMMFRSLDMQVVSSMVGPLLMNVKDGPIEGGYHLLGRDTHHGTLCYMLAAMGTSASGPALIEALRGERFLPPSAEMPYQAPYIALVSIARRDPWPDADAWLAAQARDDLPLWLDDPRAAVLSATALAALLERHQLAAEPFGMEMVEDDLLENMNCPGYRWRDPAGRQRVLAWWRKQTQR